MRQPRDTQRGRLYSAEAAARNGIPALKNMSEVQDYIDLLRDLGVVQRPVRAKFKRANSSGGVTSAHYGPREIRFARAEWALNELVVIHEIVHFGIYDRLGLGVAGHGPEFAGLMLWTTDQALGSLAHENLHTQYALKGVRANRRAVDLVGTDMAMAACRK